MNVPGCCLLCKQLQIVRQNIPQQQDISTKHQHQRSNSFQKTAQYFRFVPKFWTAKSVHGDAEQEVVSHPFPPASVLRLCCPSIRVSVLALQIVLSASLHRVAANAGSLWLFMVSDRSHGDRNGHCDCYNSYYSYQGPAMTRDLDCRLSCAGRQARAKHRDSIWILGTLWNHMSKCRSLRRHMIS